MASASAASLSGVEVPWALMWAMSDGVEPGVGQRQLHAGDGARAAGGRGGDVVGVGRGGGAEHLGEDRGAAGLGGLPLLEHQHAGALGHHEAVAVLVERAVTSAVDDMAVMLVNPAMHVGVIVDSELPVTMASQRP